MAARRAWAPWIGALACLSAATAWFFLMAPLYRPVGPDLLANAGFADGLDDWRVEGSADQVLSIPGLVALLNDGTERQVGLRQVVTVPDATLLLELRGEVAAADIVTGPKTWHAARVYAVPNAADGKPIWSRLATLAALDGTSGWRSYDTVFRLPEATRSVTVGLQMAWTGGEMQARNLSLVPVEPRGFVGPVKAILAAAWTVMLAAFGLMGWRAVPSRPMRAALPIVVGVLMVGILMPATVKSGILTLVLGAPDPSTGAAPEGPFGLFAAVRPETVGHFLMFALLAAAVERSRPVHPALWFAGLLVFAAVTELLQFFAFDRTPTLGDWLVDAAGIGTGWAVAMLAARAWTKLRQSSRTAALAPSPRPGPEPQPSRPAIGQAGR